MTCTAKHSKSPLVLSLTLGLLVIFTLVIATSYFLRPTMESELKQQLNQQLVLSGIEHTFINISGRDVTLNGAVRNIEEANMAEKIARNTWGIRGVSNHLVIKNHAVE